MAPTDSPSLTRSNEPGEVLAEERRDLRFVVDVEVRWIEREGEAYWLALRN